MHFHIVKDIRKAYYIKFGEHLQKLLIKHQKDVMTVASIGKIEPKQVYRVLNGEHGASMGTIISIAKGLEIHPKELFDFQFDLEKE
ncbi:helix-turn-helix transcriptional regulator [Flavobacterium luminosum]|uniref:Helix-turn-helix transcriptional regulator n=1 Tax=Flavobacterium luminosum TaxID=2949086 RepID=A0ABT0TQT0_9FLAO|nr:helix-turn-helix transcriptional regulator [Flavobacterium sp. HXWNR70]MCL9809859.1 helix-turn-helix transcriptional regulator [Flavobacterium sp. HXWNR70]